MKLNATEATMLKDALVEHWHNSMKHSKNEILKNKYRSMVEDFKTMQQARGKTFNLIIENR